MAPGTFVVFSLVNFLEEDTETLPSQEPRKENDPERQAFIFRDGGTMPGTFTVNVEFLENDLENGFIAPTQVRG